jgi:hypothetical protein
MLKYSRNCSGLGVGGYVLGQAFREDFLKYSCAGSSGDADNGVGSQSQQHLRQANEPTSKSTLYISSTRETQPLRYTAFIVARF